MSKIAAKQHSSAKHRYMATFRQIAIRHRLYLQTLLLMFASAALTASLANAQPTAEGAKPPALHPPATLMRIGGYGETARNSRGVYLLEFAPGDQQLASRHSDHIVRTWEVSSGKAIYECDGHDGYVKAMAYTHDGKYLLTGATGGDQFVQVWKASDGSKLHQIPGDAAIIQVLPDGEQIAVAANGRFAHLLIEDGRELAKYAGAKYPLAVSPDGRVHAGVNNNETAKINVFRPFDSKFGAYEGLETTPQGATFSHNGQLFAAFPRRKKQPVLVWAADSQGGARFKLDGHTAAVQSLAFSYDNRFLATGGWDGDVCIWEMLTGRMAARLEGHDATVCALAFSRNGKMLASGASGRLDNSILLWNTRQAIFAASLTGEELAALGGDEIWSQLASEDATAAMRLCGSLAAAPDVALPVLRERLDASVKLGDAATIKRLIAQLDDDSPKQRDEASTALAQLRPDVDPQLKAAMARRISFEHHVRLRLLLSAPARQARLGETETRRIFRAILALELTGAPALPLLKKIAADHFAPAIRDEATSALSRMKQPDAAAK